MGSLGDFFPGALRDQQLQPGAVLRTFVTTTTPPKIKYWVVVATTADALVLGTVFVNSEINPNVFPTEALRRLHVPMPLDARALFTAPCFADCSQLVPVPLEKGRQFLAEDPHCLRGHLTAAELAHLRRVLAASPRLSLREKRRFGVG